MILSQQNKGSDINGSFKLHKIYKRFTIITVVSDLKDFEIDDFEINTALE